MYLATQYQWRCVLKYHAACLLEIERGNMRWGQSFQVLQSTTLAGGFIQNSLGRSNNFGGSFQHRASNNSSRSGDFLFYCKAYQNGTCNHSNDHNGILNGETRFLRHICARCLVKNRRRAAHPDSSDTCPSRVDQNNEEL